MDNIYKEITQQDKKILSFVDHTNLSTCATWQQIKMLCDEAAAFGTASVCIPPSFVKRARKYAPSLNICTVIGFPNGYNTTKSKLFEAAEALKNGADELDTVINICDVKDAQFGNIAKELERMKALCGKKILKVIIETCLLTKEEKIKMCRIVTESGADFIKTSTGFSTGGATAEDIELFKEHIGKNVRIKAAGGIRSLENAQKFIELGCSRLGASAIVKIIKSKYEEKI